MPGADGTRRVSGRVPARRSRSSPGHRSTRRSGSRSPARCPTWPARSTTPPPSGFPAVIRRLGEVGAGKGARVVIEKPFGRDLPSSRELNEVVHEVFDEQRVFRIDHYLGKETVQNLLVLRFANSLFERVWNRDAVDHVQITVAESVGLEGRAAYYEEAGALRDMIQNHVLQVLTFLAMEPPRSLEPEAIRDEKVKLLRAVRPFGPDEVVRGQYARGMRDGTPVPA